MDTVSLTIDGQTVTAEKGRTVLQAAIEAGIRVPYYCYHPGLGIDGSCRVCIVKIEKMPKLQTSCSTPVAEGMVVHTQTPDVVDARASVFEFLLINHPLDCPVCDKGGECPLQDFSYSFGPNESRMGFERRVFDGEGVKADVDFGPTLMLNRNRCILCTRCVRFMKEVDTDAQINITDRGYGSEIATFQEEGVHSILSGNLMDVCPVGAITTRDYRFKARPWDNPEAVDTICTLCEKGCNTTAWLKAKPEWAKGARLARMTPRFNPDVNDYWMCDIGRFDYHWVEGDERLTQPLVRRATRRRRELEPALWPRSPSAWLPVADRRRCDSSSLRTRLSRNCWSSAAWRRVQSSRIRRRAELAHDRQELSRATAKFQVPSVDAPNVRGAQDLGFPVSANANGEADLSGFRADVEAGHVAGALRLRSRPRRIDRRRVVDRQREEVRQAAVPRRPRRAVDRSGQGGRRCAAGRVVDREGRDLRQYGRPAAGRRRGRWPRPAKRRRTGRSWQTSVSRSAPLSPTQAARRFERSWQRPWPAIRPTRGLATITFARPVSARTWLQTSNPSERWKWDFMYQDLPPVKFEGRHGLSSLLAAIPMKEVK